VGRRLARLGVTGVTDATHGNAADALGALEAAVARGELPQRLLVMGEPGLPEPRHPRVARGPRKLLLAESELPGFEATEAAIAAAHEAGRAVAIHCVARAELVFALAALRAAGARPGDRIEHAGVAPPQAVDEMAALGVTVVSQPNFVYERGDAYLVEVEPGDRRWLYRGRGLLAAGVPLGGGTDAPFGDPDPWRAMRAAVERRSRAGAVLAADEALRPEQALALFTTRADAPGGPPRRVAVGEPADLCLLDRPWAAARESLSSGCVAATLRGGEIIWEDDLGSDTVR
jgi:predicted amidohydrolase YtcJ